MTIVCLRGADRSEYRDVNVLRLALLWAYGAAAMTVAFLISLLATPLIAPLPTEWRGSENYAATFVPATMLPIAASLVLVPFVVGLLVAIHHLTPPHLRWASHTSVAFGAVYAAIIAANDYLQLITVRGSLMAGQLEGLDPFVWTNPYSVFGALEGLGYLFQSLALAALLPVFSSGRFARPIRWLLVTILVIGVGTIVVQLLELYVLLFPGLVLWSVVFAPAMLLVAAWLREHELPVDAT